MKWKSNYSGKAIQTEKIEKDQMQANMQDSQSTALQGTSQSWQDIEFEIQDLGHLSILDPRPVNFHLLQGTSSKNYQRLKIIDKNHNQCITVSAWSPVHHCPYMCKDINFNLIVTFVIQLLLPAT